MCEAVAPREGRLRAAFAWRDVLRDEPPHAREQDPCYCICGADLHLASMRIETALLVTVRPDGVVEVEDRVCIQRRALARAIERERAAVGFRLERARKRHAERRRRIDARRREAPTVAAHALALAALPHGAMARLFGVARKVTRGTATLPDRIALGAQRTARFLATPAGRARFRAGLTYPHGLSSRQKAVTLFLGLCVVFLTLLAAHVLVTLIVPEVAVEWRAALLLYLWGFTTSLGVPLPIEPALLAGALVIGAALAIVVTLAAKLTAAWLVFFLGDEIGDRIRKHAARRPRFAMLLARAEAFAQRYGVAAVALFLAVPGLPDTIALYVFGSLHMPIHRFLLGVAIGGVVLYTAVTYGMLRLLGIG